MNLFQNDKATYRFLFYSVSLVILGVVLHIIYELITKGTK